ncbi:MAG: ATP-binding protein [Actinomycetota bacterium]|nr:ATP-binding protein [Actinomycetota bacterium]
MLSAQLALRPTPRAPAQARATAKAVLLEWGIDAAETLDVAELVISELVTNAIRHAGSAGALLLHLEMSGGLLIAVADGSAIEPIAQELNDSSESGRGMSIVAALADSWGVDPWGDGKRVWIRIDGVDATPAPGPADAALPTARRARQSPDAELAS